jgi:hypothetical protein
VACPSPARRGRAGRRLHADRSLLFANGRGDLRRAPMRFSPTSLSRRSKPTAGFGRARCWTASAWPRRRPGR